MEQFVKYNNFRKQIATQESAKIFSGAGKSQKRISSTWEGYEEANSKLRYEKRRESFNFPWNTFLSSDRVFIAVSPY